MKTTLTLSRRTQLFKAILAFFVYLMFLILPSCQKEDTLVGNQVSQKTELNSVLLNASELSSYLSDLISKIEKMVSDGLLREGNGNALIVKIENSIKSIEKGNTYAFNGQLKALINEVENFVDNGILTPEEGQELINSAEGGIILSDGGFIDPRDGHKYPIILIGDQIWMAENLAYLPAINPISEPPVGDLNFEIKYYYVYNYYGTDVSAAKATEYYKTNGVYYSWSAAMEGAVSTDANPSEVQGACPTGWHLPSDSEWKQMEIALGMTQDQADGWGYRGTDQGTQMKSTTEWYNNGNGTNTSGFNGFPWAYRRTSAPPSSDPTLDPWFNQFTRVGYWWSATVSDSYFVYIRSLEYSNPYVKRGGLFKSCGGNIRCVKD